MITFHGYKNLSKLPSNTKIKPPQTVSRHLVSPADPPAFQSRGQKCKHNPGYIFELTNSSKMQVDDFPSYSRFHRVFTWSSFLQISRSEMHVTYHQTKFEDSSCVVIGSIYPSIAFAWSRNRIAQRSSIWFQALQKSRKRRKRFHSWRYIVFKQPLACAIWKFRTKIAPLLLFRSDFCDRKTERHQIKMALARRGASPTFQALHI